MPKLTRRTLLIATVAAPALAEAASFAPADAGLVSARTEAWIRPNAHREEMIHCWQRLESALIRKMRGVTSLEAAYTSDLPEARAMREIDQKFDATYAALGREAEAIRALPTLSLKDAVAKIELGLAIQGPYDWQDHALELAQTGLSRLKILTRS